MIKRYDRDEWLQALCLMETWHASTDELGARFDVTRGTIHAWQTGRSEPSYKTKNEIVDTCNATLDLPAQVQTAAIGLTQTCDMIEEAATIDEAQRRARVAKKRIMDGYITKLDVLVQNTPDN